MKTKLQLAKADALAHLNANRREYKMAPLKRIAGHWWNLYGAQFIARVKGGAK